MRQNRAQKPDPEKAGEEARRKRVERCGEAIKKVCAEHECEIIAALGIGEQSFQLTEIGGLPILIQLRSTK